MRKSGFTLIEILIVVAITAVLSGLAIVYSHVGQNQVALSIEESKIAQVILEAKELSIATYSTDIATCGYGVHFDYTDQTYTLFEYDSASLAQSGGRDICPSVASTTDPVNGLGIGQYEEPYTSGNSDVHVAQGVVLDGNGAAASNTIQDVLFYPPDPCTLIGLKGQSNFLENCTAGASAPPAESYVYLSTVDGSQSRAISVSPAGQVSL